MKKKCLFSMAAVLMAVNFSARAQDAPVYKNSRAAVEKRVEDLLAKMTLEEKIDMIGGYNDFYIRPNERLGIPMIKMADGPLGVRNYGPATAFPAGIAFAATWNPDLVKSFGEAIGKECRSKGVHIILAPGVNIYRAPMNGRNFEYYGEDPYLASRMAVGYVTGVQSQGVVATIKHYAANNQEWDRHTVSSDVDERTLREIYLPAFRAAVEEAHVGAVMTSYNLINGVHASQHEHLIKDILKGDWKFDGLVMSDWVSTYDAVGATNDGLDLEMPFGAFMNRKNLLPAINEGKIKVATIDDKVRRMLRVMFRMGFFDRDQLDSSLPLDNPDSRAVALQAARESIVLLKNQDYLLPLDRKRISSIAVVGPNASVAVTGGGGSSRVEALHKVSPLEGITKLAGEGVKVYYSAGVSTNYSETFAKSNFVHVIEGGVAAKGLKGEYFANMDFSGSPAFVRIDEQLDFRWQDQSPKDDFPKDNFTARWTGAIKPDKSGDYELIVRGDDGYRLYINSELVIDNWKDQPATVRKTTLPLEANREYAVKLEYYEHGGGAEISFGWQQKVDLKESEAVKFAAQSDVTVACVGFNDETESEGFDRPFNLPEEQVALLNELTKVSKKVIVVLTAGGNVAMADWLPQVQGLLHVWYPGQEGGTALAEVLFGEVNPSGKLPATFEKRWEDNATFNSYYDPDNDKRVQYTEGIFVGYRHYDKNAIEPQFAFGYGQSYTTFEYNNLKVTPEKMKKGQKVKVEFEIKNTGERPGAEVAQLYVHDVSASVSRPEKELKAFKKVWLKPGESQNVTLELDESALVFYDATKKAWVVEPGEFEVLVGSSSRLIRFRKSFTQND